MRQKRVESTTSRTAELTCLSRAASSLEKNLHYHSGDNLAVRLLPGFFQVLIRVPLFRHFFVRVMAPRGIYEYVIARTRYIDSVVSRLLSEGVDQILIFGAGFDTRALRFRDQSAGTRFFELDAPPTQRAKRDQYRKRGLVVPENLTFIPIDFERETLMEKLDASRFERSRKTLFLLEGLLMYLNRESVRSTFHTIRQYAGAGSLVVFDYVKASVLEQQGSLYGEEGAVKTVKNAGEAWQFGIEPRQLEEFLMPYGLTVVDHFDAVGLEERYFTDEMGRRAGRINGTHCIVTAIKS